MTIADIGQRPRGHALGRLQIALAAAYTAAIAVALGRAAFLAGHLYVPHQNDAVTADVVIWPGILSITLWWALLLVIAVGPVVALAAALVSAVRIAIDRRHTDRLLVVGTLLSVAVVAFWLTPIARAIVLWLID